MDLNDFLPTAITGIYALLPGFVALSVYHSLTARPRGTPFERVVEALVFTVFIRVLLGVLRRVLLIAGQCYAIGSWSVDVALGWSLILAIGLGLALAVATNKDWPYKVLRNWGWTSQNSYPSEWCSAFEEERRWITLHLAGDRRLYGFPREWPNSGADGHFVMAWPAWLLDTGELVRVYRTQKMIVPVSQVELVEFAWEESELVQDQGTIEEADAVLVKLNGEERHGQGTAEAAELDEEHPPSGNDEST